MLQNFNYTIAKIPGHNCTQELSLLPHSSCPENRRPIGEKCSAVHMRVHIVSTIRLSKYDSLNSVKCFGKSSAVA